MSKSAREAQTKIATRLLHESEQDINKYIKDKLKELSKAYMEESVMAEKDLDSLVHTLPPDLHWR